MNPLTSELLRHKYEFRWEVLDVIVRGQSSIDSNQGFHLASMEDADRFLRSYGYYLENPIERAEAFGNFHEALNFIRRYFLAGDSDGAGLKLDIPRRVLELTDIRELFLMSSTQTYGSPIDSQSAYLRNWACAILKVMHTIAHMDQDIRTPHFADIQQQIFDRYYRMIQRDAEGHLYMGERKDDPLRVDLVAFETKPKKSRDSILLKLLHKPGNVAEEVFDRVGIRFVTKNRIDSLRVIKLLKDKMVLMPPNVKPGRSRNTLIDLDAISRAQREWIQDAENGKMDEAEILRKLEVAACRPPLPVQGENPHTSSHYRAIQFTCRQLIKLKSPIFEDLKELKALAKLPGTHSDLARIAERLDLKYVQRELRFFYPYEVQLMDQISFEENERGRSAHSEYKKAQVLTAMKRVMGPLTQQT